MILRTARLALVNLKDHLACGPGASLTDGRTACCTARRRPSGMFPAGRGVPRSGRVAVLGHSSGCSTVSLALLTRSSIGTTASLKEVALSLHPKANLWAAGFVMMSSLICTGQTFTEVAKYSHQMNYLLQSLKR